MILVQSAPATRAAMHADAVDTRRDAYTKPGGNVTGSTFLADASILRLLQLLLQAVPGLRSTAVFANPTNDGAAPIIRKLRSNAAEHGIRVQIVEVAAKHRPSWAARRTLHAR